MTRLGLRWLMFLATAVVLFLPRVAEACPVCVAKEPGGAVKIAALGAMILLPFVITLVVVRTIRSSDDEETDQ